ncbi:hypothetical protein [Synechococcus elongatus]|uniref:hypothetical protein n=1 Tax=Synechococcus elongatus TaxID=32046 RepID=UPI0030CAA604
MLQRLLQGLDRLLVFNVFFVIAALVWFAIALLGRRVDWPLGFDLWMSLWQPLFQPALGLLMVGAILSGVGSWVRRRFFPEQSS